MNEARRATQIRLPEWMFDRLREIGREERRSMANAIEIAVWEYIRRHEPPDGTNGRET